jgi:glycosyltransferase involved in cell wall biosynthesis
MSSDSQGKPREGSVLWVFPYCLDHIGHGNIQRVLAIANYLADNGVSVDLVYQGNPRVASREHEFTRFRRVLRVPAWHSTQDDALLREREAYFGALELPPDNLTPGSALTLLVRGLIEAMNYTAVIGTYAWTAPIFETAAQKVLRISDVQDILHLHGERSLKATGTTTNFFMNADTEAFLWRKWDVVMAITAEEARVMRPALRPTQTLMTVPHAVRVAVQEDPGGERVLYLGSDNYSNQQAVTWLLRDVWPAVHAARRTATLRLAGLICKAIQGTPLATTAGVELAGFVDDPARELADATVVVAPYLYGSGLKIKVVETAGLSRPLVTTSGGIEGTGLLPDEHLLVADAPDAFAQAILQLLEDPGLRQRLSERARAHVVRTFSDEACYGQILALLRAARSQRDQAFTPGSIPPLVERRLRDALAVVRGQVVVWGNGSHTRALMTTLQALGATVRAILDKSVTTESTSTEGVPVLPIDRYQPRADDLLVLSSQTFEAEMWEQAAPLREAGVQVMALYRRDLLSDNLGRRLRLGEYQRLERLWATRDAAVSKRLVIAATGETADHMPQAQSLRAAGAQVGIDVLLAGSRIPRDTIAIDADETFLPTFEFSQGDAVREIDDTPWRAISRFSTLRASELERLASRVALQPDDIVLFRTTNLVDILGTTTWLARTTPDKAPAIRLFFSALISGEARALTVSEQDLRAAYRLALGLLSDRCGGRIRLLAPDTVMASDLTSTLGHPVQAVALPMPDATPQDAGAVLRAVITP